MNTILPVAPIPSAHGFQAHGVSGKLAVPVSPGVEVYAHFRHITGVSAVEGTEGVSLFKLRILDNLIDNYLKSQKPAGLRSEDVQVPVSAANVDTTIRALSADLRDAILATPDSPGALSLSTGMLLNLGA